MRPVSLTFPNMSASPFVEGEIHKHAAKLAEQCPGILSCHVVADIPHRHHKKGNPLRVHVTVQGARARDDGHARRRAGDVAPPDPRSL